jgi:hypothetical protein
MKVLLNKLKKMATRLAKEKPKLHLFALVHRVEAPDRWDLLVSSDKLAPWSMNALNYIVPRLKKALTIEEIIKISQVVVLPPTNAVVTSLANYAHTETGDISGLYPTDRFDRVYVIWPLSEQSKAVLSTQASESEKA